MKRLILSFLICVIAFPAVAQDLKQADQAFYSGKYDDAKSLYETTAALIKDKAERDKVYSLAKKCTECKKKLDEANKYYRDHNYEKALRSYKELLNLNSKDPTARSRVKAIPALIEQEKADESMWASAMALASLDGYNQYLSEFPNGKHKAEATTEINRIRKAIASSSNNDQATHQEQHQVTNKEPMEAIWAAEKEAYQSFLKARSINSGLAYLDAYPYGSYVKEVKDILVDLYCEQHDYTTASKYATSNAKTAYVQQERNKYQKSSAAIQEKEDFQRFQKSPTQSAAMRFLQKYKNGDSAQKVSEWLVKELCKNNQFSTAQQYAITPASKEYVAEYAAYTDLSNNHSVTKEKQFLDKYSNGQHYDQVVDMYVKDCIDSYSFDEAKKYANTWAQLSAISSAKENYAYNKYKNYPSSYYAQQYLDEYPEGVYQNEVRNWLVKELCKSGDYSLAIKYASIDSRLSEYVISEQKKATKLYKKDRSVLEKISEFVYDVGYDDFCNHFIDFTIGSSLLSAKEQLLPIGLMYSFVPGRLGGYVAGTWDYEGWEFSAVVGPVMRLLSDSKIDIQLYTGIGYANTPSFVGDLGIRLGYVTDTKFSLLDFNLGALYYNKSVVPYLGINIVVPLSISLAVLAL